MSVKSIEKDMAKLRFLHGQKTVIVIRHRHHNSSLLLRMVALHSTMLSSFYAPLLSLFCVSFYLCFPPPVTEVLSSHLWPKTLPISFHPVPPLSIELFASSSKASLAPTTLLWRKSLLQFRTRVCGQLAVLPGSSCREAQLQCTVPGAPTHCFSEEEGDKGEPAS